MEQEQKEPQMEEKKSGMNYAIVGVIVAIVVIAVIIVFAQNRKSTQSSTPQPISTNNQNSATAFQEKQADAIVTFDGSAFSPASITIKAGQTVEFKNESSTGMWVASAPHPTHTDYPSFDAKRAYGQGESYMFTFEKVGTWKYHIHENPPSKFGSITVE